MIETIETLTPEVACDGGSVALGHPRVFLHVDPEQGNRVTCPYCSRTFVLKQPRLNPHSTAA